MKATELKIGDILSYGGKPAKVHAIDRDCTFVVYGDDEGYSAFEEDDALAPIPLTSEILEKNGWENDNKEEDLWFIMYALGKLCIEFHEWKGCGMLALVSVRNGDDDVPLLHIKYVHELQHILWALGMDDDLKI